MFTAVFRVIRYYFIFSKNIDYLIRKVSKGDSDYIFGGKLENNIWEVVCMRLNAAFYELNAMKNVSLMQMKLIQVRDSRRKTFLFATDIIKWCFEADKCLQSMFLFYYFGWMKTPIVFLWSKINDRDHLLTNNAGLTLKTPIFDKCRRHYTIFFDIINFFFLFLRAK